VGQQAADFAVADSNGQQVTKAAALAGAQGAVFYFTMWCPICDGHMSHLREMLPLYPGVRFFLVDYVSGSITAAGDAAAASGYGNGPFTVLADVAHQLYGNFQATMGTTVVVDGGGVIRLNEDFRDGRNLRAELDLLVLN
jgi:peroxiredoxin